MVSPLEASLDCVWGQLQDGLIGRIGTEVPGIGAPKIQLAKGSSTARHTTLAVRAKAIAGRIGLQGMRTPTVCLYPWTTAGAHLVNYHQSLQVYLPRRSHHGSHIKIRVRRRESPQRTPVVVESLDTPAPLTPCVHGSHSPRPVWDHAQTTSLARTLTTKYYLLMKRISRPYEIDILCCDGRSGVNTGTPPGQKRRCQAHQS